MYTQGHNKKQKMSAAAPAAKRKAPDDGEVEIEPVYTWDAEKSLLFDEDGYVAALAPGQVDGPLGRPAVQPAVVFQKLMRGVDTSGWNWMKRYSLSNLLHVMRIRHDKSADVYCAACGTTFVCGNINSRSTNWGNGHRHIVTHHKPYALVDTDGKDAPPPASGSIRQFFGKAPNAAGAAAGAAVGGGGAAAGGAGAPALEVDDDDVLRRHDPAENTAAFESYRATIALAFLADGIPSHRIESSGEQYRYHMYMKSIVGPSARPSSTFPSLTNYKVSKSMDEAAEASAKLTAVRTRKLGSQTLGGFMPLKYALQLDKWLCDATGRDVMAIIAHMVGP